MIISHKHRYIFFAIPKTGTHAVRQALREQMGPDDLEQVGLFVQKKFPFPEFADIRHGHIGTRQIRPVLGEAVFGAYAKFAFVRNPYSRFVSFCAFMTRDSDVFGKQPLGYMKWAIREPKIMEHLLCQPQHAMLTDADGALEIDIVGRHETMQASYDSICARVGLATRPLEKVNASQHRPWQEYYDRELAGLVAGHYRRDFELFDYAID